MMRAQHRARAASRAAAPSNSHSHPLYWFLAHEGSRASVYQFADLAEEFADDSAVADMVCSSFCVGETDAPAARRRYRAEVELPVTALGSFVQFMVDRGFYDPISTLEVTA